MTTNPRIDKHQLRAGLAGHTGTEQWFRHWTRRFSYTQGVKYLADEARSYWLVDLIASYYDHPKVIAEQFVLWTLNVKPDHSATISATDGNNNELVRQDLTFTDFPLDEMKLYLTDGVLLLPSEY